MYSKEFQDSLKKVEAARKENIALEPNRMTAKEKEDLLAAYHPDYKKSEFETLKIGPNKGESVPQESSQLRGPFGFYNKCLQVRPKRHYQVFQNFLHHRHGHQTRQNPRILLSGLKFQYFFRQL